MREYPGIPIEFSDHIVRCADERVYWDAQVVDNTAGPLWAKYTFQNSDKIKQRIAEFGTFSNYFIVPGRGAFNNFYALFPHIEEWCRFQGIVMPDFLPIVAKSYEGEAKGESQEIYGLEYYIEQGLIEDGMHLTIVEDGVDSAGTWRDIRQMLDDKGLKHVTLDIICLWAKVPKCYEQSPELEDLMTYMYHIDTTGPHSDNWLWFVQGHEWGEQNSSEMIEHTTYKNIVLPGFTEIILAPHPNLSHILNSKYPANNDILAAFALARNIMDAIEREEMPFPDVTYFTWPDHKFQKLRNAHVAPGVIVDGALKAFLKWQELKRAIHEGRSPKPGVASTHWSRKDGGFNMGSGLISKGPKNLPGRDFTVFGRRNIKTALVVAREMPFSLNKGVLEDKIGAEEVYTAALTYDPHFEVPAGKIKASPDFVLSH